MLVDPQGWIVGFIRAPGPADKVYSEKNSCQMAIPHSAVGYYGGWASRLFSTARQADGRYTPYAAASVNIWVPQHGTPIQHYSLQSSCWGSGARIPNVNGPCWENEGGYNPHNEPLTLSQIYWNVLIIKAIAEHGRWPQGDWRRPVNAQDKQARLYEHNECVRFGADYTQCPSSRIPWNTIITLLRSSEAMPDAQLKAENEILKTRQLVAATYSKMAQAVINGWDGNAVLTPEEKARLKFLAALLT